MITFSILITTKNRINDLVFTLKSLQDLLERNDVECIICDDGSTDSTSKFIVENYPKIKLLQNKISKGLIFSRNRLLNHTKAQYAISLDDDANILSENPLEKIENYFNSNPKCGVVSFRIFWSEKLPFSTQSQLVAHEVRGYVGCGHAWRMSSWHSIPNYPEWFIFYGEEDFASFQLFKKKIAIHYLPTVFVHHRVNIASRKKNSDYQLRQRRSFRSGWYLYFLFYPLKLIPKKLFYTLFMQFKNKTCQGDFKATLALAQAIVDVLFNFRKLLKQSNRLTLQEFIDFEKLPSTQIYWKPEDEK